MGDGVFNIAKGKVKYYCELPATSDALIVVLLKSGGLEGDTALTDHDNLSVLLGATNDECDFTNYVRKTISTATVTVDDTNDRLDIVIANQTWTAAGGATNNSVGKLLVCYDPDTTAGTDADIVPLTFHDFVHTTSGTDLPADFAVAGFFRAA